MKILLYDLETSAIEALVWGRYDQNVSKVRRESELLTAAWKWLGDRKVQSLARPNYRLRSHKALVKKLWKLLDEADVVVAHNVKKFDKKQANKAFADFGLPNPSPYKVVDTLTESRRNFGFSSHKLEDICRFLGYKGKVKTGGIDLWDACMLNDKAALKKMERYNRRDIDLLEWWYRFMLDGGWLTNHPQPAKRPGSCCGCGGLRLKAHGRDYRAAGTVRRFRCLDCGKENLTELEPYKTPKIAAKPRGSR